MAVELQQITKTYTSFSGADIKCVFGNHIIMECQGISYSVTREKAPIYTLGSADPRSFSRGKRGIAGSIIFTIFDRDPMSILVSETNKLYWYYAKKDEMKDPSQYGNTMSANRELIDNGGMPVGVELRRPLYHDQVLPFDITITAQNEYGQMAIQRIFGVEILNAGAGLSVDDIVNETQATFVARSMTQWAPTILSSDYTLDAIGFYDRVSELSRQQSGTGSAVGMQVLE